MSQGDPSNQVEETNSMMHMIRLLIETQDKMIEKQDTNSMMHMIGLFIEKQDKMIGQLTKILDKTTGLFLKKQDEIIELLKEIAKHDKKKSGDDNSITTWGRVDEPSPADLEIKKRRLKLHRAALNGDWEVAKRIHETHKEDFGVGITTGGKTLLHIAVQAKRIDFVKELMNIMSEDDAAREDINGLTALHEAAASGMVGLAKLIIDKNENTASFRNVNDYLPIDMAAFLGHKDMVHYLYSKTKSSLDEGGRILLFLILIDSNLNDIALQLLMDHPELATTRASSNGETALHVLSRKHLPSPNQKSAGFFKKCFGFDSSITNVENEKHPTVKLVECIWEKVVLLSDSKMEELITKPWPLISEAAKQGNVEFLSILICEYPNILWHQDKDNYSIFHLAVLNRQEDIFKLIHEIGSIMDVLASQIDEKGNTILHLAGMMAPINRLNIVPGAALQMQRELLWFQAVSKVVQPGYREMKNIEGLTPKDLFLKNHEDLRKEGEKWLKNTATSCMVVATLITTLAFTAAFMVPGGNKGDTGLPFFLKKLSFKTFAISDAISLVSSSTSILNFLSIFTSRHAQEDFLVLSPRKLHVGLLTLFISIAAMMVMFATTFFIAFKDGRLWIAILVAIIASTPVLVFTCQHYRLFCDVLTTTYGSHSLFKPRKRNLFYKPEEAIDHREYKQFSEHLTIQCPF